MQRERLTDSEAKSKSNPRPSTMQGTPKMSRRSPQPNSTANSETAIQKARAARLTSLDSQAEAKRKRLAGRKPIPRDQSYPLEVFRQLAGLSESGLAAARLAGLQVKRVGDSAWVTGEEWFRFLNEAGPSTQLTGKNAGKNQCKRAAK